MSAFCGLYIVACRSKCISLLETGRKWWEVKGLGERKKNKGRKIREGKDKGKEKDREE